MNNEEICKKIWNKRRLPYFFSEECLKFYSKNDIELIKTQTIGLMNLHFLGMTMMKIINIIFKTNNTVKYELLWERV